MAKPKILIVDDEPFNVDYLEQELEELNCETIAAVNGQDALDKVRAESPDLILLDIMMPVMDGFEMLRQLKAEPNWRDIPVVIISALTDTDNVVRGIQLGADDYLPKPFNPTLLGARINAGLVRKRLRDLEKVHLQRLEKELEIGHQIQSGFLPSDLPEVSGWGIAAHFQAAREVAGDFYDVFRLSDGRLGFFLGDVADKGVGSALFMALYRSLLRAFINDGSSPDVNELAVGSAELLVQAVTRTNQYVCHTHANALFATLFIGVLDPLIGRVQYINAGHYPPQVLRRDGSRWDLKPTGPVIGFFENIEYSAEVVELGLGEALFIYSDGVEDTVNGAGEFYGQERLWELLALPSNSAAEYVGRLSTSLEKFMGEAKPFDDVTMLVIMRQEDYLECEVEDVNE
jgi:serine phosphatase RsbU (regulator of sigma subunit)